MQITTWGFPIQRPGVTAEDLQKAAQNHDATYFDKFLLGILLQLNPRKAYLEAVEILEECRATDQQAFEQVPKGTIYYWMGMAAYLMHDFDGAGLLMDNAAAEDLAYGPSTKPRPAELFLRLDGAVREQAAQTLVQDLGKTLTELVDYYCGLTGTATPHLTVDQIRGHLIDPAVGSSTGQWRTLCTTLISFLAEYPVREALLASCPEIRSNGPFYLHLAKGCLLFESLLKSDPKHRLSGDTIGQLFRSSGAASLALSRQVTTGAVRFSGVLNLVAQCPTDVTDAIEITAQTRNTVAHNLDWNQTPSRDEYDNLYRAVGASCLHAVATLYR